jgi:lipoprotein NlpD
MLVLALPLGGCQNLPPLARPERYVGPAPLIYYVRQGDTIYSIGRSFGVSPGKIRRWNPNVDPADLQVGQPLYLRPPPWREWAQAGDGEGASGEDSSASGDSSSQPRPATPADAQALDWQWPLKGEVIRKFSASGKQVSNGIHIAGAEGSTVRAAAGGQVVYAGDGLRGYGNLVILRHSKHYLTAYGYNQELLVAEDDQVQGGEPVAKVGQTGAAERPSLHFEVRRRADPIDPLAVLPER